MSPPEDAPSSPRIPRASPGDAKRFEELLEFLKVKRGLDLTGYKRPTLRRRVHKRMGGVKVESYDAYIDYLEVHPGEFSALLNTVLINVTGFFRDAEAWAYMADRVIPDLIERAGDDPIRIWSAGCATGEEPYTLIMLFAEALGTEGCRQRVKIYATDADEEELVKARVGRYSLERVKDVPERLRERYFESEAGGYAFRNDLRRSVIFGKHDLVQDAPISRLDLLVCRNTLMYFNREVQGRLLARFHFALRGGGVLFLGKAEMLSQDELFAPLSLKHRVFVTRERANLRDRLLVLSQAGTEEAGRRVAREVRLREIGFDVAPEAQVVVDARGRVALINERARAVFGLTHDHVGTPFSDLEFSYTPVDLRTPLDKVLKERQTVKLNGVALRRDRGREEGGDESGADGADGTRYFDVRVVPLVGENGGKNGESAFLGASIIFQNVTAHKRLQHDLKSANGALETAFEELQSSNEELETTNEELQSTIEELETTNEELQSTNEELETMNEEMQSTNEELETMNDELRRRTDEIDRMNGFLNAILSSLQAGVVVLDHHLNIYIWNTHAEELWGLRADEVVGRSIFALDIGLPVERLRAPVRTLLAGGAQPEALALDAVNRRGRSITCRVMVSAMDSFDDALRGVILLMEERKEGA